MTTQVQNGVEGRVFRKTNIHVARKVYVTPEDSSMQHLTFGRIILGKAHPVVKFPTNARETGLICLRGEGVVTAEGKTVSLGRYDAYIPRDSSVGVRTGSSVDMAEFSAEVAKRYPLQVVRSADIAEDADLRFTTGKQSNTRHIHMLLAKNIEAGQLIIGITECDPGNWTSWPPHEHAKMLDEIYVYFDMPEPAYGLQLVGNGGTPRGRGSSVRSGERPARVRARRQRTGRRTE